MPAPPLKEFEVSPHAAAQMQRRTIPMSLLESVLGSPDQRWEVRPGREVFQAKVGASTGLSFLVRVFVDVDRIPPLVVTVYRTRKIAKYWRGHP